MGCYVPCKSACLTPLDRIITRVGGSDDIFASSSTFKMELDEVNRVLWEATDRSFITIDELGRGTCVRDGAAIAYAVLHDVATRIGCVGFFATHYHSLTRDFSNHPAVAPKRMRIRLPEQGQGIIFTYQLEDGIADGSYGMHCAAACGIPSTIIRQAEAVAVQASLGHTLRPGHPGNNTVLAGWQSDIAHILREEASDRSIDILLAAIASGL